MSQEHQQGYCKLPSGNNLYITTVVCSMFTVQCSYVEIEWREEKNIQHTEERKVNTFRQQSCVHIEFNRRSFRCYWLGWTLYFVHSSLLQSSIIIVTCIRREMKLLYSRRGGDCGGPEQRNILFFIIMMNCSSIRGSFIVCFIPIYTRPKDELIRNSSSSYCSFWIQRRCCISTDHQRGVDIVI